MITKIVNAIFILILFNECSNAVKREDFKTCAQSGFCTRQRNTRSCQVNFRADLNRLIQSESSSIFDFPILHDVDNTEFIGKLTCLADSTFRFQIMEKNPERVRYTPNEALSSQNLERGKCTVDEHSASKFTMSNNDIELIIQSDPFILIILQNNQSVFSLNSDGFLNFETYRSNRSLNNQRKSPVAFKSPNESNTNHDIDDLPEEFDAPVSCEERFKEHVDKNPFCHTSIGVDITFWNTEHVFGIPEHADSFALKSTCDGDPYRLYNMDVFQYEFNSRMGLYGAVPYMLSHSENQTNGVFWFNAAETWVDINSTEHRTMIGSLIRRIKNCFKKQNDKKDVNIKRIQTRWMSETGNLDVFFMLGPNPNDVFRQYAKLTGTTPLPPMFSLGYHQSRWNYFSEEEVLGILDKFESKGLPLDVIWLDIEHTNGRRYFTWNIDKFPDPIAMTNKLDKYGRKLVTIVDPHIKVDNSYSVYKQTADLHLNIKSSDGVSDFQGSCWPGSSTYIDFLNPAARKWYSDNYALDKYSGSTLNTYIWNDMNEPSVFSGPEVTIPKDTIHHGGFENRDIHNIYGSLMFMSTYEGLVKRSNFKLRPFILSRSFFAGSQRSGAIWTGDNTNDWGHLKISISMLLSLSVTGISFCGADVGGFFDSSKETELFVRWFQAGSLLPFFRVHSHIDSIRREPWVFDTDAYNRMEQALHLRYAMIPTWYTLFYENEQSGVPPMRPLWSVFPKDKLVFDIETSYMLGSSLLICPVVDPKISEMNIYFPGKNQIWYDDQLMVYDGGEYDTIQIYPSTIPRFQKGGSIIFYKKRIRRSTKPMLIDPYTLIIALDQEGYAEGTLFMDDGESFNYKNTNSFYYRNISMNKNVITSTLIDGNIDFVTKEWIEGIYVGGLMQKPTDIQLISQERGDLKVQTNVSISLAFQYNQQGHILMIRRPGINANRDWRIEIN